mmetsp:Transcript_24798/g.68645  ORF Transcript_24798/g.68645 Transcript_24798/m.68645 type:complete len:411 (+) Transcript_24798:21-1253(+)
MAAAFRAAAIRTTAYYRGIHHRCAASALSSCMSTSSPRPVDLVWNRSSEEDSRAIIHLVERHSNLEDGDSHPEQEAQLAKYTIEDQAVPETVLQFERQMRKAQHEKKAGKKPENLDVIYADDDLVVVNKPSGVLTVPGINQLGCLLDLVHERYGPKDDAVEPSPSNKAHMTVHRLDMDTSGLVAFGRTLEITKELHTQLRNHKVEKEYRAVVVGHWPEWCQTGRIDLPLKRDHEFPPFMRVATPQSEVEAHQVLKDLQKVGWKKLVKQNPKPSVTEFQVLSRGTTREHTLPYTVLRLIPVTGRTHQLRVHCAALGFSILGDPTYSLYGEASPGGGIEKLQHFVATGENSETKEPIPRPPLSLQKDWTTHFQPNDEPMCLQAAKLVFTHPKTKEKLCFEVDSNFDSLLDKL